MIIPYPMDRNKPLDAQQFFNLACRYFIDDTERYLQMIQPFPTFSSMIRTVNSWGILNRQLPTKPKEQNIIGDGRRWIYVTRCLSYFLEQALKEKQGEPTEMGKAYKLISISRPIGAIFTNTWQIKYNPTLCHFSIETNMDYNSFQGSGILQARLLYTAKEAMAITGKYVQYFKDVSPTDVIKKWSLSYGMDTLHIDQ